MSNVPYLAWRFNGAARSSDCRRVAGPNAKDMGCEEDVASRKPWGQTRQFEQRAWRVSIEAWMPVPGRRVRLREGVKTGSEWGAERRGLSVRSVGGEVSKSYGKGKRGGGSGRDVLDPSALGYTMNMRAFFMPAPMPKPTQE
jgi:hypothetical protein